MRGSFSGCLALEAFVVNDPVRQRRIWGAFSGSSTSTPYTVRNPVRQRRTLGSLSGCFASVPYEVPDPVRSEHMLGALSESLSFLPYKVPDPVRRGRGRRMSGARAPGPRSRPRDPGLEARGGPSRDIPQARSPSRASSARFRATCAED